jgi:hypothetical protein
VYKSGLVYNENAAIDGSEFTGAQIGSASGTGAGSLEIAPGAGGAGTVQALYLWAMLRVAKTGTASKAYVGYMGQTCDISAYGGQTAWYRFPFAGGNWTNSVSFWVTQFGSMDHCEIYLNEVRFEYNFMPTISGSGADGISATAISQTVAVSSLSGNSSADVVIGQEVTVDVLGHMDDTSGTYTGSPSSVIQRPDHILKHILMSRMGFSSGAIGGTFAASGASYAGKGYALAFILHDVATNAPDLLSRLAVQCRSLFFEWAGKFELKYLPDSAPPEDLVVHPEEVDEEPRFSFQSTGEIRNKLRVFYRRRYERGSGSGAGSSVLTGLDPDAVAAGYLAIYQCSASPADLEEDMFFPAVRLDAMAQDVAAWWLNWRKVSRLRVALALKWRAMQLAPGGYFSWSDPMMGNKTYRVTRFHPDHASGRILVEGIGA